MVLVVNDGSSKRRLNKHELEECEYGFADLPVFAIRDFPNRCGRSFKAGELSVHNVIESQTIEVLGNDVLLELVDASNDCISKMVHMVSSDDDEEEEEEEEELAELADDGGIVDPLALLEHEASAMSKEAILTSYPLWRRISANRDFPLVCGSNSRRISSSRDRPLGYRNNTIADSEETYLKSIGFNVLDHNIANVEDNKFDEVVKSGDIKQAQSGVDDILLGKSSQMKDSTGKNIKAASDTNLCRSSPKFTSRNLEGMREVQSGKWRKIF